MINSVGSQYSMNTDFYNPYKNYGKINGEDGRVNGNRGTSPTGKKECQTCKNRKYVDGSDEGNVSFKTPSHVSASNSAAAVVAHEYQHVANAVREGNKERNKLLSVSVSIKTAVCPECGRVYTSGGETRTTMLKSRGNENDAKDSLNPYEAGRMLVERFLGQGQNINLAI